MGFRNAVRRSTLADANERRDWRIYGDVAQHLIATARPLYASEDLGLDLAHTIYTLNATLIELCVSLFSWHAIAPPGCGAITPFGATDAQRVALQKSAALTTTYGV